MAFYSCIYKVIKVQGPHAFNYKCPWLKNSVRSKSNSNASSSFPDLSLSSNSVKLKSSEVTLTRWTPKDATQFAGLSVKRKSQLCWLPQSSLIPWNRKQRRFRLRRSIVLVKPTNVNLIKISKSLNPIIVALLFYKDLRALHCEWEVFAPGEQAGPVLM